MKKETLSSNIKRNFEFLKEIGSTKDQILNMTVSFPVIYGYSIENMKQKLEDMINLGYTKDQVIEMTLSFPAIYSCNIENIKRKILYLRKIGLGDVIIKNPKQLMQSVDLTYARYEYLTKKKNIKITYKNYAQLFKSAKSFEKNYGIKKSDLLQKYPYNKKIESKTGDKILSKV